MLSLGSQHRYHLYNGVVDMRKGFDGLSGLVQNELGRDPLSGEVFIFVNRSRNRMKLLVWEEGGFVLWYKRLEQGTFELPVGELNTPSLSVSWSKLLMIVEGIKLESVVKRKRFSFEKAGKKIAQKAV